LCESVAHVRIPECWAHCLSQTDVTAKPLPSLVSF
jgi:hypothetical protein